MNLAFEEHLFETFETEVLRLWKNPSSVIVGKHQNALKESNVHYCIEQQIPIIRRISGGGTVYHDLGNVNFSFFRWIQRDKMIDYRAGLDLIHKALLDLGYPVTMNQRHDLYLNDFKVSGNAQHLKKDKSLHHGTLLYDANLDALRASIKRTSGDYVDKGVASVRSPIANLRAFKDLGDTNEFIALLTKSLINQGLETMIIQGLDNHRLEEIAQERYLKDEWNFGYSPPYELTHSNEQRRLKMMVERGGKISFIEIQDGGKRLYNIEKALLGTKHFYTETSNLLKSIGITENNRSEWLKLLF